MIRYTLYTLIATLVAYALLTNISIYNNQTHTPVHMTKKNVIAFDLGGVLIENNFYFMLKKLGFFNLICYTLSTRNSLKAIRKKMYTVFNLIEQRDDACSFHDDLGYELPSLFCDWLSGNKSLETIRNLVLPAIKKNNDWFTNSFEQKLVYNLAEMLFTPEYFIKTKKICPEGLAFAKECKKDGHYLCILSNWDAESFALLKDQFSELFDLFDKIIISGDVNCLKPDKKIYQELLTQIKSRDEIIFIDDQKINRDAAQACGITVINCPQKTSLMGATYRPDFNVVRTVFSELNNTVKQEKF